MGLLCPGKHGTEGKSGILTQQALTRAAEEVQITQLQDAQYRWIARENDHVRITFLSNL